MSLIQEIEQLFRKYELEYLFKFVPARDICYVLDYKHSLGKRKKLITAIWSNAGMTELIGIDKLQPILDAYVKHDSEIEDFVVNYKTYTDARIEASVKAVERFFKDILDL